METDLLSSLADILILSLCLPQTGRCPDQPGRGLPVRGEVNTLVQPSELQILEEAGQGAPASRSSRARPCGECEKWADWGEGGDEPMPRGGEEPQGKGKRKQMGRESRAGMVFPMCPWPNSLMGFHFLLPYSAVTYIASLI